MSFKQAFLKNNVAGHIAMIRSAIVAGSLLATAAMAQPTHYAVIDLGNVGPVGQPFQVTNNNLISGASAVGTALHAVLWYRGRMLDLATTGLGGQNSQAFGVNVWGQAVGEAETAQPAEGEDFCSFGLLGLPSAGGTCLPFLWQNGAMNPLPTLGGNNGIATKINSLGVVAGTAENSTPDSCLHGLLQNQSKPVVWRNRAAQELPTYPGDPDGAVFGINDAGQAAGASGTCTPGSVLTPVNLQPLHALLWESGQPIDLGNLGGTGLFFGIQAENLNNRGQVIGWSDIQGNTNFHAFLWTRETGMLDLETLSGDVNSLAIGINDAGQIVGASLDANFNPRAFLRVNETLIDLNTLVPADTSLYLVTACSINDRSEIIGIAIDKTTGDVHGYLAVPKNNGQDEGGEQGWPGHGLSAPSEESSQRPQFQRFAIGKR